MNNFIFIYSCVFIGPLSNDKSRLLTQWYVKESPFVLTQWPCEGRLESTHSALQKDHSTSWLPLDRNWFLLFQTDVMLSLAVLKWLLVKAVEKFQMLIKISIFKYDWLKNNVYEFMLNVLNVECFSYKTDFWRTITCLRLHPLQILLCIWVLERCWLRLTECVMPRLMPWHCLRPTRVWFLNLCVTEFGEQYAAVKGISLVTISRITMAAPGMGKKFVWS